MRSRPCYVAGWGKKGCRLQWHDPELPARTYLMSPEPCREQAVLVLQQDQALPGVVYCATFPRRRRATASAVVVAIVAHLPRLFERLFALVDGEVDQAHRPEAVDEAEAAELID